MDRRKFLKAGAAVSAVTFADGAFAAAYSEPTRFALGYHSGLEDGYWMNARLRPFDDVQEKVRIMMLGVQAATPGPKSHPLRAFDLELLYKVDGLHEGYAPYKWARLSRLSGLHASKGVNHEIAADGIFGVRVRYEVTKGNSFDTFEEMLSFTAANVPRITPGFYAIVGPSQKTMNPPAWTTLAAPASGGKAISLKTGAPNDFDAVLIAVEPA